MSFCPGSIAAGAETLAERSDLAQDGYTVKKLANGDYEVRLRQSRAKEISLQGN